MTFEPAFSSQAESPVSVAGAVWTLRLICSAAAAGVLGLSYTAFATGEVAWFAVFLAAFFLLAVLVSVAATIPRRQQQARNRQWGARLHELAIRDELSGLHNRRYFSAVLEEEVRRAHQSGSDLSLLVLDLDDFKRINDTFGHPAGDAAIRVAAEALSGAADPGATVARIGGDEFAVIAPGLGELRARALRGRLLQALEQASFLVATPTSTVLTACIGVAPLEADMEAEDLFHEADRCLYAAKAKRQQQDRRRLAA
jgi:diguanylate cyclase (GGDEF)-like protein